MKEYVRVSLRMYGTPRPGRSKGYVNDHVHEAASSTTQHNTEG